MAAYSLETLLKHWALNQLSTEQAIGQILQILHDLEPRVKRLEQAIPAKAKRRRGRPTLPPSTPPGTPRDP